MNWKAVLKDNQQSQNWQDFEPNILDYTDTIAGESGVGGGRGGGGGNQANTHP